MNAARTLEVFRLEFTHSLRRPLFWVQLLLLAFMTFMLAAGKAPIVRRAVEKGLLMFSPVGYGGASVKIAPPLIIPEEPLRESLAVIEEVLAETLP